MSIYKVPVRVIFTGEVKVECDNPFQAEEIAKGLEANLGETNDGGYKQIIDWCICINSSKIETEEPMEGE